MEGILSQEEIDALLGGGSDPEPEVEEHIVKTIKLTKKEEDAIGEMGNISIGSSSTALSTLLMREVSITTPKVEVLTFADLKKDLKGGEKVLIKIEYKSGFSGLNILLLKKEDAVVIGDLMMGNEGTNPPAELDDLYLSAVGESMNQMMGSSATALAGMFSKDIDINPPEVAIEDIEKLKRQTDFFQENKEFIGVKFKLEIKDLINTNIYQIMSYDFSKMIVKEMFALSGEEEASQQTPNMGQHEQPMQQPMYQQPMQQPMYQQPMYQQPMYQQPMQQPMYQQPMQQPSMMGNYNMYQQQQQVNIQPAQFSNFGTPNYQNLPTNIDLIMDVPLEVTVELGRTKMQIKDILDLGTGSIVELDKLAGEPVDVLVNGKLIAKGEVVVIDESFGIRITDIVSQMERLTKVQ